MKKELSKEQEEFCVAVANGSSLVDAYVAAFPKSANWKRESAQNKGHELSKRDYIAERIQEIKRPLKEKVEKEFIYTKEMAVKVLAKISLDQNNKNQDIISATKALIDLLGLAAPPATQKIDHSSSDGTMSPSSADLGAAVLEAIKKKYECE